MLLEYINIMSMFKLEQNFLSFGQVLSYVHNLQRVCVFVCMCVRAYMCVCVLHVHVCMYIIIPM